MIIDQSQLGRLRPVCFIASLEGECWDVGICHRDEKAFRPGDGIAQNLFLIKSISRKKREQLQKFNLTFIEVRKAFDSVSHKSILRAAARLGTPPLFLYYLAELYKESEAYLKTKEGLSGKVQVKRGVRQGDPMSPYLFNAVIDMITSELDQSIGFAAGICSTTKCNYIAFADRLVLMSMTIGHWNEKTAGTIRECNEKHRLRINPNKCAALRIETHCKENRWIVNSTPYIKLQSEDIRAIYVSQSYKYLRIQVGVRKQPASIGDEIQKLLHLISRTNKTLPTSLHFKSSFVTKPRS